MTSRIRFSVLGRTSTRPLDIDKTLTDSQLEKLIDKIEWSTEDETTDVVTAAQHFGTRIYKQHRVNMEQDYLDSYFTDETRKERKNDISRLAVKLINQVTYLRLKEIMICSYT